MVTFLKGCHTVGQSFFPNRRKKKKDYRLIKEIFQKSLVVSRRIHEKSDGSFNIEGYKTGRDWFQFVFRLVWGSKFLFNIVFYPCFRSSNPCFLSSKSTVWFHFRSFSTVFRSRILSPLRVFCLAVELCSKTRGRNQRFYRTLGSK